MLMPFILSWLSLIRHRKLVFQSCDLQLDWTITFYCTKVNLTPLNSSNHPSYNDLKEGHKCVKKCSLFVVVLGVV